MKRASVERLHEVINGDPGQWNLCFQWVRYHYTDDSPSQMGYRFIWRRPNGSLQAAMGQARIPSAAEMFTLIQKATKAGWFVSAEASRDDQDTVEQYDEIEEVQ